MNQLSVLLRESRVARFLIPGGIILIVLGIIFFRVTIGQQDYIKADSTVVKVELEEEAHTDSDGSRVEATYTVTVRFTADGREWEAELPAMPECRTGETMTIYYDPADPSRITQSKSLVIPMIMIGAGAAAFVGGVVSGGNGIKRYQKMKRQEQEWKNGN